VLRSLCEAFFPAGGEELQISVLDAEQLRAAKAHPKHFRDLVVRIAGLNARFVELSELEQDEMIRRAEAAGRDDPPGRSRRIGPLVVRANRQKQSPGVNCGRSPGARLPGCDLRVKGEWWRRRESNPRP